MMGFLHPAFLHYACQQTMTPQAELTFMMGFSMLSGTMLTAKVLPGCSIVSMPLSFFTAMVMPGGSNDACSAADYHHETHKPLSTKVEMINCWPDPSSLQCMKLSPFVYAAMQRSM
jgi:hypothetical protein